MNNIITFHVNLKAGFTLFNTANEFLKICTEKWILDNSFACLYFIGSLVLYFSKKYGFKHLNMHVVTHRQTKLNCWHV